MTTVEVLVALLLTGLLVHLGWRTVAVTSRGLGRMVHRGELLQAERIVWWTLVDETERGRPGRDWGVETPDVLWIRAFRGEAVACPEGLGPGGTIRVAYLGWRRPDPTKDSLFLLDGEGRVIGTAGLTDDQPDDGGCPVWPGWPGTGDAEARRWTLDPAPVRPPVVLRLFERGSYHLEDGAFRYRRGEGGRQPLTAEVLDPAGSGVEAAGPSGAVVSVLGRPPGEEGVVAADGGWSRLLAGSGR